jgi:hypothetical protein
MRDVQESSNRRFRLVRCLLIPFGMCWQRQPNSFTSSFAVQSLLGIHTQVKAAFGPITELMNVNGLGQVRVTKTNGSSRVVRDSALVLALPLARLELDPLTLYLLGEHYELSTAGGCMKSGFRPLARGLAALEQPPLTAYCRHSPVPRLNSRQEVIDARGQRKNPSGVLLS